MKLLTVRTAHFPSEVDTIEWRSDPIDTGGVFYLVRLKGSDRTGWTTAEELASALWEKGEDKCRDRQSP